MSPNEHRSVAERSQKCRRNAHPVHSSLLSFVSLLFLRLKKSVITRSKLKWRRSTGCLLRPSQTYGQKFIGLRQRKRNFGPICSNTPMTGKMWNTSLGGQRRKRLPGHRGQADIFPLCPSAKTHSSPSLAHGLQHAVRHLRRQTPGVGRVLSGWSRPWSSSATHWRKPPIDCSLRRTNLAG